MMTIIKNTKELHALCSQLAQEPFITIDTEFLRDKTYYPKLCLVQLAPPEGEAVAVDPLAGELDLGPLLDLLANETVVKVFHAARQDLEIFYNLTDVIPHPIFDTQVAAMVCGYGDQIGYNKLVQGICGQKIDKGAQFTDWARRPLTGRQLSYALDDVTYLRDIYRHLKKELDKRGREKWVKEEMATLTAVKTYENPPDIAWQRVKIKSDKPRILAVLREVAAWREKEAQRRDVPRGRVLRDETMADMAVHPPENTEDLLHIRNMPEDIARGKYGGELLSAVQRALEIPKDQCPRPKKKERLPPELTPVLEVLKMLLRIQASEHEVAAKLIATRTDMEALALDDKADIPALKGWRYEVYGKDALDLKHGKIALGLKKNNITKIKS